MLKSPPSSTKKALHPGPARNPSVKPLLTPPPHRTRTPRLPLPSPYLDLLWGGRKTAKSLSDWVPLLGRARIGRSSEGQVLEARLQAIGRRPLRAARSLAEKGSRSRAGGRSHWLESRLVVRRSVASQAESRSGTGVPSLIIALTALQRGTDPLPPIR